MANGNGEVARIILPPIKEFVVTRQEKHGGDQLVKCHSLGLGRGGALICYLVRAGIDPEGNPMAEQTVVRIFNHYLDVEEVDIPNLPVKH